MAAIERQDAEMLLWTTEGETPFGPEAKLFRAMNPDDMDAALAEAYGKDDEGAYGEDGARIVALVAAMREYSPADYPVTVGVYN